MRTLINAFKLLSKVWRLKIFLVIGAIFWLIVVSWINFESNIENIAIAQNPTTYFWLILIIGGIIWMIIRVWIHKYLWSIQTGKPVNMHISDLLSRAGLLFFGWFIFSLVTTLGMYIFIVPWLYLFVKRFFIHVVYSVEEDVTFLQWFSKSAQLVSWRRRKTFWQVLVPFLAVVVGILLLGVGIWYLIGWLNIQGLFDNVPGLTIWIVIWYLVFVRLMYMAVITVLYDEYTTLESTWNTIEA